MRRPTMLLKAVLSVCVLVSGFLGSPAGLAAIAVGSEANGVVAGNNTFAFDLYGQLRKDAGNLFFSPFSISTALTMTYAGARGETAVQMADTLRLALPQEELHPAVSRLLGTINAGGKGYQLATANALWGQAGFGFNQAFLDATDKYYDGGFREVDYVSSQNREQARRAINAWVESKTNSRIKELITRDPEVLDATTRLVLVNAIYFKGDWELRFDPRMTRDLPFEVSSTEKPLVPMMSQTARFSYGEDDNAQALEMRYQGGDLSMLLLLPKPGLGLEALEAMLSPTTLDALTATMYRQTVDVMVPRFKVEKGFGLNGQLEALGMRDAFDPDRADFSGMADGGLYISNVVHKAFIEVNEKGTEAAAATAVVMSGKSLSFDLPPVFQADRPFVFIIRDTRTGSILFMGRVADPR